MVCLGNICINTQHKGDDDDDDDDDNNNSDQFAETINDYPGHVSITACIMALLLLHTTGNNILHAVIFLQYKQWKIILQYSLTNIHRVPMYHRIFTVAVMWRFERELTHDIHSIQDHCVV